MSPLVELSDLPSHGRMLGIDVGDRSVGLALSDPSQMVASPLSTLTGPKPSIFQEILKLVKERDICAIVIGWPVHMSGEEGERCAATKVFIEKLSKYVSIPIAFWDERLSSRVVDQLMIQENLSRKQRQKRIDKLAAAYILQGALDRRHYDRMEATP